MKKLAIIIGHGSDKKINSGRIVQDKGCYLFYMPEDLVDVYIHERDIMFDFGQMLCENIFENVTFRNERLNLLFLSKEGKETERDIVKAVNRFNPDLAVELHANASTCQASGSEILIGINKIESVNNMVTITSTMRSFSLSEWLNKFTSEIARTLNIRNRGIKIRKKGGRGHYFLSKTKCLSIITEPFFLDRESDYQAYLNNKDKLIMCFTQHILDFIYGG